MPVLVALLLFSFGFTSLEAKTLKAHGAAWALHKNINVDELTESAGIIFKGRFVKKEIVQEGKLHIRKLTFTVTEPIKGIDQSKTKTTIKEWAQIHSPLNELDGKKEYLFFFYPESRLGLTSLIGLEQGAVEVTTNGRLIFNRRIDSRSSKIVALSSNPAAFKRLHGTRQYVRKYEDLKKICKASESK